MNNKRSLQGVVIALLVTAAVATVGFGPQEEKNLAEIASDFYAGTPVFDIGLAEISQPPPLAASESSAVVERDVQAIDLDTVGATLFRRVATIDSVTTSPVVRDVQARSTATPINLANGLDTVLTGIFKALAPSTVTVDASSAGGFVRSAEDVELG